MDDKSVKQDKKTKESQHLKEVEEYKAKYLRALADYQNFERRSREEREDFVRETEARLFLKLLPFLDHLEKAEVFIKDQGLQMIKEQFMQTLEKMGIEEVEVLGKEFDPHVAEAVDVVDGEEDNKVVEVLQKGYRYNGKILRVAHVKVSKKNS